MMTMRIITETYYRIEKHDHNKQFDKNNDAIEHDNKP